MSKALLVSNHTLVNKIKTYENNQAYQQNWFSNIVLVGGDSFIGDSKAIDEGEYINQKVIDIMDVSLLIMGYFDP